jgi:two-component system chemotaxis response regulator CheY
MKVLLVDDSKTMRNIQKKVLTQIAQEFGEAGDGVEALEAIGGEAGKFDLVMIDWNMPNMNGFELIQKIREFDKKTPLIMCTTEAEKGRVVEAIKAGVNNYVVKPFTPDGFLEKVNSTLARLAAAA